MLSPPRSASSSIMDQNRAAAGSSSRGEAQFPGQTTSSYYPPTSGADYYHSSTNAFPPPSGTAVGAPEPSPPPSLLGQAAAGAQAGSSSFTSTWITPASTEELAAAGDDDDNSFADTDFVYENGRRYHAPASGRVVYPLPNDESEQERDDMKHKLALWMMHEKLLYAPVEEALKRGGMVFDLGMLPLPLYLDTSGPCFSHPAYNFHQPLSLKTARPTCVFSFFFSSPCQLPGCSISPVSRHFQPTATGPGSLASRAEQYATHVAFSFWGVPQIRN